MTVSASAQFTVHSGGIFDWVISNPTSVGDGSESLVSFILTIVGDATNVPQAFDSRASSLGGINGPLHQEHGPVLGVAGETPVDGTTFATDIDTHFLLDGIPHAFDSGTGAPQEDYLVNSFEAPLTGGALAAFATTSFGSFLTMTATKTGAAPATWDLAQVVVPANSVVNVNGQVANDGGVKDDVADFDIDLSQLGGGPTGPIPPCVWMSDLQDPNSEVTLDPVLGTVVFDPHSLQIIPGDPAVPNQSGSVEIAGLAAVPQSPLIVLLEVNPLQGTINELIAALDECDGVTATPEANIFHPQFNIKLVMDRTGSDVQFFNFDFTGIAEVGDIGIIPVPAALPLGLGGLALMARRRRAA
ncbi:MAG: hypothetical protein CMJ49_00890 [Planctomycetaceae bacterium]|nr:hypothetical protein [Planctomycetaceae bacterium]